MATIIDTLLIKLGFETADLKKGQKEAVDGAEKFGKTANKANKDAEESARKAADAYNKAKNEIASLVAIAVGARGLKEFVATMVQGNATLGRTAYYMNLSARELSAWRATAEAAGGTAEGFEASIQGIQQAFQALRYGQGDARVAGIFKSFGIAYADAQGKARPLKDILLDLATVFNKMKPQDQLYLAKQLGLDDGTLNLLRQGRDSVQKLYQTMYEASGVTDENVKAASRLQSKWAEFKQQADGIAQSLFQNLSPALEGVLSLLTKGIDYVRQIDKASGGWVTTIVALQGGLFALSKTLGTIAAIKNFIFGGGGAAGGAAGAGVLGTLSRWLGPLSLLFHSGGLNTNEDAELKRLQAEGAAMGNPYAGGGGKLPRGLRNNNPGNLRYGEFAQRMGAIGKDDKGFAVFSDMNAGSNAGMELLRSYMRRGYDTIEEIISRWAPSNENNTAAYIAAVSKSLGVNSRQQLNDQQLAQLSQAIFTHENGPAYRNMLGAGMNARGGGNTSTTTVETRIGTLNVQTQATDANGIARDLPQALSNTQLVTASVSNMN